MNDFGYVWRDTLIVSDSLCTISSCGTGDDVITHSLGTIAFKMFALKWIAMLRRHKSNTKKLNPTPK